MAGTKSWLGWTAAALVLVILASSIWAAEAAPVGKKEITLLDNIKSAGLIGVVIILLSIAGLSLVIIFFVNIRRDALVPPDLLEHIEQLFEDEDYNAALEVCEGNPSFLSTILAAGLQKTDRGWTSIEKAMLDAGEEEATNLHQRVGYLGLVANLAPMLGLLGTVVGMVKAFNVIAQSSVQPSPKDLAHGISMALMTTVMGLIVAIPMTAFFIFFRNRVINAVIEVGNITEELMERFRSA